MRKRLFITGSELIEFVHIMYNGRGGGGRGEDKQTNTRLIYMTANIISLHASIHNKHTFFFISPAVY